jgi:hypothetical protein
VTTEVLEETLYQLGPLEGDGVVKALNRIATALEQLVLERAAPKAPQFAPLPKTQPILAPASVCPIHNAPWKIVPAGVSKKTGNSYDAFAACPIQGCDQRPPR